MDKPVTVTEQQISLVASVVKDAVEASFSAREAAEKTTFTKEDVVSEVVAAVVSALELHFAPPVADMYHGDDIVTALKDLQQRVRISKETPPEFWQALKRAVEIRTVQLTKLD